MNILYNNRTFHFPSGQEHVLPGVIRCSLTQTLNSRPVSPHKSATWLFPLHNCSCFNVARLLILLPASRSRKANYFLPISRRAAPHHLTGSGSTHHQQSQVTWLESSFDTADHCCCTYIVVGNIVVGNIVVEHTLLSATLLSNIHWCRQHCDVLRSFWHCTSIRLATNAIINLRFTITTIDQWLNKIAGYLVNVEVF